MTPSLEARELLKEEHEKLPPNYSDIVISLVCAIICVAIWAAEKYFEERVTEQERVERTQRQIQQPKLMEM